MLVLSRKAGEQIILGNNVVVTVVRCSNGRVRLAFDAPEHVTILRGELVQQRRARAEADSRPAAAEEHPSTSWAQAQKPDPAPSLIIEEAGL